MLGRLGSVLQQLADAITTGPIVLAIGMIAISICGYSWAIGRMHAYTAACVVIGIAVVGSAATIAGALIG